MCSSPATFPDEAGGPRAGRGGTSAAPGPARRLTGPGLPPGPELGRAYIERCAAALGAMMETPTAGLVALEDGVADGLGRDAVGRLNRDLMRELQRRHRGALGELDVPVEVRAFWAEDFERLSAEIDGRPSSALTFRNYRFKADCRLLALRRMPLGMWDLEVTGIPWRLFLAQPAGDVPRLVWVIATSGGTRPYFRQHMAPRRMRLFNPEGRRQFMRLMAEMLRRRPSVKGFVSGGWYNDGEIHRVAPHLAYLRETLAEISAGIFRVGSSPDVVDDALANSPVRRRLYEQGQYRPVSYMGIAPRRKVLRVHG